MKMFQDLLRGFGDLKFNPILTVSFTDFSPAIFIDNPCLKLRGSLLDPVCLLEKRTYFFAIIFVIFLIHLLRNDDLNSDNCYLKTDIDMSVIISLQMLYVFSA